MYATTLITGIGKIYNMPVGIIANNGILFGESALKGEFTIYLYWILNAYVILIFHCLDLFRSSFHRVMLPKKYTVIILTKYYWFYGWKEV